jgi:hypothetical protein
MRTYHLMAKYGLPLTREHYTAIGQLVAIWQVVEITVQAAIWATLRLDGDQGRLVTASLRFDTHLDVMSVLAMQQQPAEADIIREMVKETKTLQDKRNGVVHGLWQLSDDLIAPRARRFRMKDAAQPPPTYTPEEINAIADQVANMRQRWLDFILERAASPQKPEPQDPAPTSSLS